MCFRHAGLLRRRRKKGEVSRRYAEVKRTVLPAGSVHKKFTERSRTIHERFGDLWPRPGSMLLTQTEAVHAELERILNSTEFSSSPRLLRFLRYCVEQTCDGRLENLKESV